MECLPPTLDTLILCNYGRGHHQFGVVNRKNRLTRYIRRAFRPHRKARTNTCQWSVSGTARALLAGLRELIVWCERTHEPYNDTSYGLLAGAWAFQNLRRVVFVDVVAHFSYYLILFELPTAHLVELVLDMRPEIRHEYSTTDATLNTCLVADFSCLHNLRRLCLIGEPVVAIGSSTVGCDCSIVGPIRTRNPRTGDDTIMTYLCMRMPSVLLPPSIECVDLVIKLVDSRRDVRHTDVTIPWIPTLCRVAWNFDPNDIQIGHAFFPGYWELPVGRQPLPNATWMATTTVKGISVPPVFAQQPSVRRHRVIPVVVVVSPETPDNAMQTWVLSRVATAEADRVWPATMCSGIPEIYREV